MLAFIFINSLLLLSCLTLQGEASGGSVFGMQIPGRTVRCVYTETDKPNQKIGFYYMVQGGDTFTVDITVKNPKEDVVYHEKEEQWGDLAFNAPVIGEYSICFDNQDSHEKLIEFSLHREDDPHRATHFIPHPLTPEKLSALEESMIIMQAKIQHVLRDFDRHRQYENFDEEHLRQIEGRMRFGAYLVGALVLVIAGSQQYVIRRLFQHSHQPL